METIAQSAQSQKTLNAVVGSTFQFLKVHFLSYLKLSFIIFIPVAILMIAAWYGINAAWGAPKIPKPATALSEMNADTTSTVVIPDENITPDPGRNSEVLTGSEDFGMGLNNQNFFLTMLISSAAILAPLLILGALSTIFFLYINMVFTRMTILLGRDEAFHYGEILKWGLRKLGSYILLGIRIFMYTGGWLILGAIAGLVLTKMLNIESLILSVFWMAAFPAIGLIMAIRYLYASFSRWALADKEFSSKEALETSLRITKGHWGEIFIFTLGVGIGLAVCRGILVYGFDLINEWAGIMMSIVSNILIGYFLIVFNYKFYTWLVSAASSMPNVIPPTASPNA